MYEGTLDGLKVCVKRVRVYTKDGPRKAARVHFFFGATAFPVRHH